MKNKNHLEYNLKKLPKDAYIIKLLGVDVCPSRNRKGYFMKISYDIAEGMYKGFYAEDYEIQPWEDKKWHGTYYLNIPNHDETDKEVYIRSNFDRFVSKIEESNPGYTFDWDEQKMVGLLAGGLFNIREYTNKKNRVIKVTNLERICSVDDIRNGRYKLPKDKLLGTSNVSDNTRANIEIMYDSSTGDFYHYEWI